MPSSREPYVTAGEVAAYLAVSERTVGRLVKQKAIPSYIVLGQRRFRLGEVDQWIQRSRFHPPTRAGRNPVCAT